ncbi:MAG TPA: general stress protein [Bryobacteraceae bacterium]|nr:general stress protein [Bryobacteraceae bacterium]
MAGKNTAVFGIYTTRAGAEAAVDELRAAGFRNTDISVLMEDNAGTKEFAHEKNTKAPEGATTGGITGGVIGGALGWLAGIGALAIPGVGPFIAAGPIMGLLGGAGIGGAIGGLVGVLIGLGIPEYEAKRYEGRIKSGGILLSVHADDSDWTKRAKDILERTGAQDISSTGEAKGDFANTDRPMHRGDEIVTETTRPRRR